MAAPLQRSIRKSVEPGPSRPRRRLRFLWPRNDTARGISLFIVRPLVAETFYESGNVFGPPDSCARAELDGLGMAPGEATFSPGTFAHGEDFKNMGQKEKAVRRNGRLLLVLHKKNREPCHVQGTMPLNRSPARCAPCKRNTPQVGFRAVLPTQSAGEPPAINFSQSLSLGGRAGSASPKVPLHAVFVDFREQGRAGKPQHACRARAVAAAQSQSFIDNQCAHFIHKCVKGVLPCAFVKKPPHVIF